MPNNDTTYTIQPEELDSLRALLIYQYRYGPFRQLTDADYTDYMGNTFYLSDMSARFQNTKLKEWVNTFYGGLIGIENFEKISVSYCYWTFFWKDPESRTRGYDGSNPWVGFWDCFIRGWKCWDIGGDQWVGPAYPRVAVKAWNDKLEALRNTWGDDPSADYLDKGKGRSIDDFGTIAHTGHVALSKWWKDHRLAVANNKTLWTNQLALFKTLKGPSSAALTASDYFFLFFLLLALPTGGEVPKTIQDLLALTGDTSDYTNETFANHLTFLLLLVLANPTGTFNYNHNQLLDFTKSIRAIISTNGPIEAILKAALDSKTDILNGDVGYPYIDDSPQERINETVALLNTLKLAR